MIKMPDNFISRGSGRGRLIGGRMKILIHGMILGLLILSARDLSAQPPSDFLLEAFGGSYAPYGSNYELVINADGSFTFYWSDMETDSTYEVIDTIGTSDVEAIYDTATAVSFFSLNNLYEGNWADGSGILLRITANSQVHSVEAKNYELLALNRIVWTINDIMAPFGVELKYHFRGN